MLWQIYVVPKPGQPDLEARRVADEINELRIGPVGQTRFARGYLIEGKLQRQDVERIGRELLADSVTEDFCVNDGHDSSGHSVDQHSVPARRDNQQSAPSTHEGSIANVLLKPGVMDPVAQSVEQAISQLGVTVEHVRTFRRYSIEGADSAELRRQIAERVLANDAIEQVVWGPLRLERLEHGTPYRFELVRIPIRTMTDGELERLNRDGQLSLSLAEMQTIQRHFREQGRDLTDAELETLAQTWSEHCSHKTLRGRIDYEELDSHGRVVRREHFENLLKETIFRATEEIRRRGGPEHDRCVSVFEDNAGVIQFDEEFNVCFKVETHNHPSAIEPYGGANTGVGGVIRDPLGTGLGAKPIANTDVFCFAPPDYGQGSGDRGQGSGGNLPPGVLHPKRVMKGVVAGVRDYGNRMGIPTVNGAIYFDERYLGNPLVFCGTVGLIPRDRSRKEPKAGDLIVVVGGRTGRDGIHGATFSSVELTHASEELSGGAVQIGNAITEKMMLDVILAARDRGLYDAITDCGAGGFSSAVGEMGQEIGAEVWLERAPLKYQGLSYSEIWISESQERMVLAVPECNWTEFHRLCASEGVEATVIGRFEPTGRLLLKYEGQVVGDLDMRILHHGRPPVVRKAVYRSGVRSQESEVGGQWSVASGQWAEEASMFKVQGSDPQSAIHNPQFPTAPHSRLTKPEPRFNEALRRILSSWNVCSKEWVIRQYDHEVQGGSVIKPLVGAASDGPSDAAVIRPVLGSYRGLAIACGMNPHYGDLDPYCMAASAIDEAIRNCVAVGADPNRIAILDNFCWGNTERPEELGKLVRAALACRDVAIAYGTPFISGKDSLNNEFRMKAEGGGRRAEGQNGDDRIVIPPTLLISALGQIEDVHRCVTMDFKQPENEIFLLGLTANELGGSHYALVTGRQGGQVPRVNTDLARAVFQALHQAITLGYVRSCHDLSEGGLAVAAAEMALAGGLGASIGLFSPWSHAKSEDEVPEPAVISADLERQLFAESNSRFLVEVSPDHDDHFHRLVEEFIPFPDDPDAGWPFVLIGYVTEQPELVFTEVPPTENWHKERVLIRLPVSELKECWQRPLRW